MPEAIKECERRDHHLRHQHQLDAQPRRSDKVLDELSSQTGAKPFTTFSRRHGVSFKSIEEELRSQYALVYTRRTSSPTAPSEPFIYIATIAAIRYAPRRATLRRASEALAAKCCINQLRARSRPRSSVFPDHSLRPERRVPIQDDLPLLVSL